MDIDDVLDPEGAAGYGMTCLGVPGRPPVITRSGRAVKTGYLKNRFPPLGGRLPGLGRLLHHSPTLFGAASLTTTDSTIATTVFGIISFVFAFPTTYMIDHGGPGEKERRGALL